ncbi:hypothetical protein CR513_17585, partial [Mucuna pruriens]
MPNTTYGMILTYGDFAVTTSFAGAFLTPRSIRSSSFVMQHLEATHHFQRRLSISLHLRKMRTLQKITNPNRKDWSRLFMDDLWGHRTAYRTLLGMSPYRIVFVPPTGDMETISLMEPAPPDDTP